MNKLKFKIVIAILFFVTVLYFGMGLINSYFGWYGYEKWKDRRSTLGNKAGLVSLTV